MGTMSRDTMHKALLAGVARLSAPAASVAADPFAFAGNFGAPMSITADQKWLQTWDLRSAYPVKHTHRPPTRRPLERSP